MLKDYQTKNVKANNTGGAPVQAADRAKVEPPKPEAESLALIKRVEALEAIAESAFVVRPDGTVKRLKKGINR